MPQLDISTYGAQMIWTISCFSVILLIAFIFAFPKMSFTMKSRAAMIAQNHQHAVDISDQIKGIRSDIKNLQVKLDEDVSEILNNTRAKIEEMEKSSAASLEAKDKVQRVDLQKKISKIKHDIRSEIESDIIKISDVIYQKITGSQENLPSEGKNYMKIIEKHKKEDD